MKSTIRTSYGRGAEDGEKHFFYLPGTLRVSAQNLGLTEEILWRKKRIC